MNQFVDLERGSVGMVHVLNVKIQNVGNVKPVKIQNQKDVARTEYVPIETWKIKD